MDELLHHKRHSLAHVLAAAVLEQFPEAKLGVGPVIEHGFYYDFLLPRPLTPEDLPKLEARMKELVNAGLPFERTDLPTAEAKAYFTDHNQPFKVELIADIEKFGTTKASEIFGEELHDGATDETGSDEHITVSLYKTGQFTDLCRGGHVANTSEIDPDSFTLDKISGAYWRGNEEQESLTRVYGLAFNTADELQAYQTQLEEAKKRDHKILGPQLKLFTISPLIGSGLPLLQPKGMIIRKAVTDFLWELHEPFGYQQVWTPHIAKESLYETSGHAAKFGDELFRVQGKDEKFFLKPMNCPHHMQIFADNQFSYRDMPVRYFEPATVYRDEKSGQLGGLTRVRAITQDDGHLFCRVSQISDESSVIIGVIKKFYEAVGMLDNYWVRLSLRGEDKSAYLGTDEVWATAEQALEAVCKKENLPYKPAMGEAAFYGPKLDFMFKDAIGREWQLATVQCDFNLPERFDLSYVNEQGQKERPVVIHRAISGSLERFLGVMIEHYAGAFPTWLAPVQVKVLPISDKQRDFAVAQIAELKKLVPGLRVELDDRSESVGKRIREASMEKVPYLAVIGDKEIEAGAVAVRGRGELDLGAIPVADFAARLLDEISNRKATQA